MAKFKKRMLGSRTYYPPDAPDGMTVTPERIQHWAKTFDQFKAQNLSVPIAWGHANDPEDSQPIDKPTRLPQDTVGYLDAFNVAQDGNSAELVLDVRRKEDIDKVRHNLADLSPVIFESWTDGDGKVWNDCITHVDLVQHPVDHKQSKFEPVTACALRMGLDTGNPVIYRLQKDPEMADENGDSVATETTVEETTVADDSGRMKKVLEALAKMDIVLSDDTNEENFLEHLEQALLTADAQNNEGGGDATGDVEVATPEFAALSLEREKERKYMDRQLQGTVQTRLSALLESGRCTPAEAKEKQTEVKAVRLSLDQDGSPIPSGLESWIVSREAVPEGTFWDSAKRTRMSDVYVEQIPAEMADELTPEAADKVADEVLKKV